MENLELILSEQPFFKGLNQTQLKILAGCASSVHFPEGSFIFRTGGLASEFYLICDGRVRLETTGARGKTTTVLELANGDIVGWSWLVPPYRWKLDANVLDATRALKVNGNCLRDKWEKDHDLGFELLKRFVEVSERRLEAVHRALAMVTEVA